MENYSKKAWVIKCENSTVTDEYLDIIGNCFKKIGFEVFFVNSYKKIKCKKQDVVVCARLIDAINIYFKKSKKIVVWFQGIEPEESFMRNGSKFRELILSAIEKMVLKNSSFSFFVSREMKKHFEAKYKIAIEENRCYCMPCLNTSIHKETFFVPQKYSKNTFAYVGSLEVWQRFEYTVEQYCKIEKELNGDSRLYVFTKEKEKAELILNSHNCKNYTIDFAPNDLLPLKLSKIKYGFILRENTAVNRVATPTKISTYLSCGLIPIFSECLEDFNNIASEMRFAVKDSKDLAVVIKTKSKEIVNPHSIFEEYNAIFQSYYSPSFHSDLVITRLAKLF